MSLGTPSLTGNPSQEGETSHAREFSGIKTVSIKLISFLMFQILAI
jgi:hypothetical protein